MINDVTEKIMKLKAEKDVYILAHSYQGREITEVADYVGDSYMLSLAAQKTTAKNIIMCGVHFMAETAKMLSPNKRVFLANPNASCPMAEQFTAEDIIKMKEEESDRAVVAYINTTAALKAVCDVCVTSSTADKIVSKMEADKILFIPDCNLGTFVKNKLPNKDIKLVKGGCPIHASITVEDLEKAKSLYPNALVLVHPECIPNVANKADYVGSTSGIMNFAKESNAKEFIIGTEMSIVEHLQYECPDKKFYILSKKFICPDMKLTTLVDVLNTIEGIDNNTAFEIKMTDDEIAKSRRCIDAMISLGG